MYILKRILLFLPTLLLVSLLAFGLSKMTVGDPVTDFLMENPFSQVNQPSDFATAKQTYQLTAEKLNLARPAFYFSITSKAFPDTLHRIITKDRREATRKIIEQFGNWPEIEAYFQAHEKLYLALLATPDSVRRNIIDAKLGIGDLTVATHPLTIEAKLEEVGTSIKSDSLAYLFLGKNFTELSIRWAAVKSGATPGKLKIPAFHWHGLDNQYHHWVSHFIQGDFGLSVHNRLPVAKKIGPALFWTVVLNVGAIVLAFFASIPLGVWAAVKRGQRTDRAISLGTFMLYSMPAFWVGTMLVIFFTSRAYGMDIFPGPGLGDIPTGAPWWEKIWLAAPHLMLPVLCTSYPAIAFVTRQVRGSMAEALSQDFVRTARAKGLSEKRVIWRHAFRNALFPIITLLAGILPGAIAGSLVIELVFNLPGMGPALFLAILQKDWPIVLTVLMLGSVLTMLGILMADLLYAAADPRVRLDGGRQTVDG